MAAVGEPPGRAEIGGGMNSDRETVERVAERLRRVDPGSLTERMEAAALLRELLRERDEARELAVRWRDVYEWDAIGHPLPAFYFPWEKKP